MAVHAVDKPLGLTSHDAVARARRLLRTRRVGHTGTLDPLATGVLVLLSGEATKLSPFLTGSDKEYLAWVAFGLGTPTLDAEPPAETEVQRASPSALADVTRARVAEAATDFLDLTSQRPPAYSAVKRAGERSYAAARRGAAEEPPPRPVGYRSVELLGFAATREELAKTFAPSPAGWRPAGPRTPGAVTPALPSPLAPLPTALFALRVAAGTYVRAFARDLGAAVGVPAHLSGLLRTRAGRVDLAECVPLTDLATAPTLDPLAVLPYPSLPLDALTAAAVRQGKAVRLRLHGTTALLDESGALAAIVEPGPEDRLRYLRVWQRGLAP